jgi:hypothetical protein
MPGLGGFTKRASKLPHYHLSCTNDGSAYPINAAIDVAQHTLEQRQCPRTAGRRAASKSLIPRRLRVPPANHESETAHHSAIASLIPAIVAFHFGPDFKSRTLPDARADYEQNVAKDSPSDFIVSRRNCHDSHASRP